MARRPTAFRAVTQGLAQSLLIRALPIRTLPTRALPAGALIAGALSVGIAGAAHAQLTPTLDQGDQGGPAFSAPSPPLGGASPSGRGLGPQLTPSPDEPTGTNNAFGLPGGLGRQPPSTGVRAYTLTPRIDLSEAYNTDANGGFGGNGGGRQRADFITYFTPSISATADTPRLQGSLFYAPTVQIYARQGNEDSVGQNLNAQGVLTVVPDLFYVSAQGFAAVEPRFGATASGTFGGFGSGANNLPSQQQTQVTTFSVEPYALHRFGDVGTLKVGYDFVQSNNSDNGSFNPIGPGNGPNTQSALLANTGNADVTTNSEIGQFTSGNILGRVRSVTLVSLSQYSGSGVDRNAFENFYTEEVGYALTHRIAVFGEGGYEQIRYATVPTTRIDDAVWSVGTRLTPNPDSTIIVGYGHKFGFDSVFANGVYEITPRTRISGIYSTSLGTALQGVQDLVTNGALDAYGNPVDENTGAPTYVSSGQLGTSGNNSLYRIARFDGSITTDRDNDSFSLSFDAITERLVGTAANSTLSAQQLGSQRSYSGIGSWRRTISENLSATASVTYGVTRQSGQTTNDQTVGFDLVANRTISETLSAYARYTYYQRLSDVVGQGYTQNIIQVGISKTF